MLFSKGAVQQQPLSGAELSGEVTAPEGERELTVEGRRRETAGSIPHGPVSDDGALNSGGGATPTVTGLSRDERGGDRVSVRGRKWMAPRRSPPLGESVTNSNGGGISGRDSILDYITEEHRRNDSVQVGVVTSHGGLVVRPGWRGAENAGQVVRTPEEGAVLPALTEKWGRHPPTAARLAKSPVGATTGKRSV